MRGPRGVPVGIAVPVGAARRRTSEKTPFADGPAFLRRVVHALPCGARVVNVDRDTREMPVGPPVDHRVSRETFLRHARRAGLVMVGERCFLPYQYFLEFWVRPRAASR